MIDLINSDRRRYFDFLMLSLGQAIINAVRSNIVWLIPMTVYSFYRLRDRKLQIVMLLFLLGFIPIQLIAFTHVRYLARFYPLFLYLIYAYLADLAPEQNQRARRLITGGLYALLALQTVQSFPVWSTGEWFPD